jgi:hypothetical protein
VFQNWEVLVLSRLNWNVATITPLDFLELLLARLPIENNATRCADISLEKIRKHAQTFIGLATRGEYISIQQYLHIAKQFHVFMLIMLFTCDIFGIIFMHKHRVAEIKANKSNRNVVCLLAVSLPIPIY